MDIICKLGAIFAESKVTLYAAMDIPVQLSEIDKKVNEIIDYYACISQDEQDKIHKSVTVEMAWFLLCFGIRMATYSLRLSSQKYFTNGLLAIGATWGILDRRELLIILPLYNDAQKKKGLSFDEILKKQNEFTSVLKEFNNRDENEKTLECMGYTIELDEDNNQTYRRTW